MAHFPLRHPADPDRQPLYVREHIQAEKDIDIVNEPPHYKHGPIEVIDLIEGFKLNYHLGNVVKYILRSDHKGNRVQDLRKAQWYLNREIERIAGKPEPGPQ